MKLNDPDTIRAATVVFTATAATVVMGFNVGAGWLYRTDCLAKGGEVRDCWDRAILISGLGSAGPLAAAVGISTYVVGGMNGRKKGHEEGYEEGYWTLNPDLRSSPVDNPDERP